MSLIKSLYRNSIANAAGIGMAALVQIISIPVLISAWGAEKYGLWAMLTTIPTYFALTDLGFVQAATSDMTMETARGNREKANATFQSIWLMFLCVCGGSFLLAGISLFLLSGHPFSVSSWLTENSLIIFLLILFSGLTLISRVTVAGFRASGLYAQGTIYYDSLVFVETLLMLATVHAGGGFEAAIYTLLMARVCNIILIYIILRRHVPWLYYGAEKASVLELKRLFKPAIGAMAIPVALAINIQGMVLIVGAVISPAAVAIYTPVRTASRLLIQIIGVVNRATMPAISASKAQGKAENFAQMIRINMRMIMFMLVPGGILFAITGPRIVSLWTDGHIVPDQTFVFLMALAMIIHGCWYFFSNIMLSTNSHTGFSTKIFLSSVICTVISYFCAKYFGLTGAAVALLTSEIICIFFVIPHILDTAKEIKRAP